MIATIIILKIEFNINFKKTVKNSFKFKKEF